MKRIQLSRLVLSVGGMDTSMSAFLKDALIFATNAKGTGRSAMTKSSEPICSEWRCPVCGHNSYYAHQDGPCGGMRRVMFRHCEGCTVRFTDPKRFNANTQHTRSPSVAGGSVCSGLDSGRCLHDEKFGWGPCSQKCVMNAEVTGAVPSNDLLEGETE